VQPADIAIALRRRTPWEAMDLGLAMLQRWWRQVYAPHLVVGIGVALVGWGLSAWAGKAALALLFVWWLKPLYDRVLLHVLSRAVFGEVQSARQVLGSAREWLGTGLLMALTFGRFDIARSFNLPVRQLEGQRARAGRERRGVLGRRVGSYATWLHLVCFAFEILVLYWGLTQFTAIVLPAKANEGRDFFEAFYTGSLFGYHHASPMRSRFSCSSRSTSPRASRSTSTGARCSRAGTSRSRCARSRSATPRPCCSSSAACCRWSAFPRDRKIRGGKSPRS
jgi:hypothetical protein